MHRLAVMILVAAGTSLCRADPATENREWVEGNVTSMFADFQSTTFFPNPEKKNLLAVYCERDPAWWGHLRVFQHTGDKIDWAATFPAEYLEQRGHYILSCRWKRFKQLESDVIELFESSHMGNGSLWLLELKDREFRVLLHTSAVGRYWSTAPELEIPFEGEARFAGPHLDVSYPTPEGADQEMVKLTGTISVRDSEGKEVHQRPFSETWTWDEAKRCFVNPE